MVSPTTTLLRLGLDPAASFSLKAYTETKNNMSVNAGNHFGTKYICTYITGSRKSAPAILNISRGAWIGRSSGFPG
jgi:hypothetical protein